MKATERIESARDFLPSKLSLSAMREAVQACRGCDLYKYATQAVFGEGSGRAECVLVGEQPGNDEDLEGRPFVGPAGRVLDKALEEVGISRELIYTTNAVKHFKFDVMGKKRKHRSPNRGERTACRPWLEEELRIIKPKVLVCLGVTASESVFGRKVTLRDERGRFIKSQLCEQTLVTAHPSSILRSIDEESREANYNQFVSDLKMVRTRLEVKR